MKSEFLRLRRSGLIYALILLPIVLIVTLSVYYIGTANNYIISLPKVVNSNIIHGIIQDRLFYYVWTDKAIRIICAFTAVALAVFMFNIDFYYKTHISVYSIKKSIKKLMLNKFLVYLTTLIIIYISLKLITMFISFNLENKIDSVIFVGKHIRVASRTDYLINSSLFTLINYVYIAIIIFMISLFRHSLFVSIGINVFVLIIFGFIFHSYLPEYSLFYSIYDIFIETADYWNALLYAILKTMIILIFLLISITRFKKIDLA